MSCAFGPLGTESDDCHTLLARGFALQAWSWRAFGQNCFESSRSKLGEGLVVKGGLCPKFEECLAHLGLWVLNLTTVIHFWLEGSRSKLGAGGLLAPIASRVRAPSLELEGLVVKGGLCFKFEECLMLLGL